MNLRQIVSWFGLLLWLFVISSCSKQEKSQSIESAAIFSDSTVVAIINGETIHEDDINKAITQFLNQLGKDPDLFKNQQTDSALWKDAFNWIVSTRLLVQEALRQNIEVDENEVDRALNMIKGRFPSEQKFFDALKEAQLSMEQFINNISNDLKVQKLLEQKVGSKIEDVSDEDALNFYNEHGEKFMKEEQIRVHHILIKVPETADPPKVKDAENKAIKILERIKKGEDFEKLSRQYSEDPSALKGGDIGFFERGDMIKNFEDAAFALKIGEVSDLVRTPLGFHIIRMDERNPTDKIPFEEAKIEIKFKLKQERSDKMLEQYVEELKSKANIKLRDAD